MSDETRRLKYRVFMRSGNSFEITVEEMEATKNTTTQRLTGLQWKNKIPEWLYIDLDQVEAIVEVIDG